MSSPIERLICRRCKWYSTSDGRHRKCYYGQPRCPIGWAAIILSTLAAIIKIKLRSKSYRGRESA